MTGMTGRQFRRHFASSTAMLGCSQVVNGVALLLIARGVGPASFGRQAAVLGLATLVAVLLDGGTSSVHQRELAIDHARDGGSVSARGALLAPLVCVALIAAVWAQMLVIFIVCAYGAALALANLQAAALRSRGQFTQASLLLLLDRVFVLGSVLALLRVRPGDALLLALLAGTISRLLLTSVWTRRDDSLTTERLSMRTSMAQYWRGRPFLAMSLLNESQRVDVALVERLSGSVDAGLFAAPARMTAPLGVPALAVSGMLLTTVSARGGRILRQEKGIILGICLFYGLLAMIAAPFTGDIMRLLLGAPYASSGLILTVYLVAMVPASANGMLSSVLAARHEERFLARASGASLVVSLTAVAVGSYWEGALGGSAGFAMGQLLQTILYAARMRRPS